MKCRRYFSHYLSTLSLSILSIYSSNTLSEAHPEGLPESADIQLASAPSQWYEKSFQEILNSKIITATRTTSSVNDVPGVVSVYTSNDIQRMGLRSVKELLERTTGFFINRQLTGASIGSRGIMADTDQFLMLIDGHSLNSIVDRGMGESFLFPNLEHVERVEIIRGPGSTLWGSDASLGIIHVITKDGAAIDGARATVNRDEDDTTHVNLQAGEAITDDIDVMASLTVARSDGFQVIGLGGKPFDGLFWDEMKNSYELYAKAKVRNLTIKARVSQTNISRPYKIKQALNEAGYSERSHYYVDITHNKKFTDKFSLETRLFSGILARIQTSVTPLLTSGAVTGQANQSSQEDRLGIEMIARWQVLDDHQLLFGLKKIRTEISPVTDKVSFQIDTSVMSSGAISHLVIPDEIDDTTAVFFEDNWQVIPNKLSLIAGIRFDKNNIREATTIALPRFALNWNIYEPLQFKYSYNTGYIRPSAGIGFLGQEHSSPEFGNLKRVGIKKSQEIASHDIQFIYTKGEFRGNINFYHTRVENPFQILVEPDDYVAPTKVAYYINTNTISTTGAELELAYQFSSAFDVYGSMSKVFGASIDSMVGSAGGVNYDLNNSLFGFGEGTFTQDGTMSAFPHLMVNVGLNWALYENTVGNLHLRYWDDMSLRDVFEKKSTVVLGAEYFVDFNMRFTKIFTHFFVSTLCFYSFGHHGLI